MDIPYRQLTEKEALKVYADWLLEQQVEEPFTFFRCLEHGKLKAEWYMIFYPLRTLILAGQLFGDTKYIQTAEKYIDLYLTEQLPNGGFTSNYRQTPTAQLTKAQFEEILRTGKVNLADNGSNIGGIIQASRNVSPEKRKKYLTAAKRWFDNWVPIWALPDGGYGNGIWVGHKINSPYTCAIGTTTMALAFFGLETGEYEYIENAERAIRFQCSKWLPDGRPINLNCYPLPSEEVLVDYGHSFYLLEGMCWTHFASKNEEVKELIATRMTEWIFGQEGLLAQWSGSWFNYMARCWQVPPGEMKLSRSGIRLGWEMAKSNAIIHCFLYYLNHIEDNPALREKVELGVKYLTHPLKARMSGVVSDPEESYGAFAVQATGFAGLSLAEAIQPDIVFAGLPQVEAPHSMLDI